MRKRAASPPVTTRWSKVSDKRQHATGRDVAIVHDGPLTDAAGADDRHLRRHHHEAGEAAADHAEVGERDGRATQLVRRDRARQRVGAHAVEAGTQIARIALGRHCAAPER